MRSAFPTLQPLLDAADDVRALLASPGWAHLSALIEAELSDLDRQLDGKLHEHTEYAYLHGQRRGMGAPVGLAHAIVSVADQRLAEVRAHNAAADAVAQGAR